MGAAGLVAPGTLPVVFFSRDVSFFGTTGMAATVAESFGAVVVPVAAAAPALEGGTGRGGSVMRTVSFFSCLAASPAGGVTSAIMNRSIAADQRLSKFFQTMFQSEHGRSMKERMLLKNHGRIARIAGLGARASCPPSVAI